jgi:hypothetical protein
MPTVQLIGGNPIRTPELNDVSYSPQDPQCVQYGDGKWCFKWVTLSVSAPAGWAFIPGSEMVVCIEDNQGSAAWNGLPYATSSNKLQIQSFGPNLITARALMQSRSILIQLRANAQYLHSAGGVVLPNYIGLNY